MGGEREREVGGGKGERSGWGEGREKWVLTAEVEKVGEEKAVLVEGLELRDVALLEVRPQCLAATHTLLRQQTLQHGTHHVQLCVLGGGEEGKECVSVLGGGGRWEGRGGEGRGGEGRGVGSVCGGACVLQCTSIVAIINA